MKVRELIEHLQTLDQERGIWICYDYGCSWFAPVPDEQADRPYRDGKIKEGDYIIYAG